MSDIDPEQYQLWLEVIQAMYALEDAIVGGDETQITRCERLHKEADTRFHQYVQRKESESK